METAARSEIQQRQQHLCVSCRLATNISKEERIYFETIYILLQALRMGGQTTHNKQGAPIGHMHKHMLICVMSLGFQSYIRLV
jgi:hypothetical protein